MRDIIREITEEYYNEYKKDPTSFIKKEQDNLPMSWVCGYGYYGLNVYEKDNKYYISYKLGSSCD